MSRQMVRKLKQYIDPNATIIAPDTRIPWKSQYKPGCADMITNNVISSHITSKEVNKPYRRWSPIHV